MVGLDSNMLRRLVRHRGAVLGGEGEEIRGLLKGGYGISTCESDGDHGYATL